MDLQHFDRRDFLKFLGLTALTGCASLKNDESLPFRPLPPTDSDALTLADGFEYDVIVHDREVINSAGEPFGTNCDYTAFLPLHGKQNEGLLWVNHEYFNPLLLHGKSPKELFAKKKREKKYIDQEQLHMGGSFVHIKKKTNGHWEFIKNSKYNQRVTAKTNIPFAGGISVLGKSSAMGMVSNCAGGITPWGTILTCEENYQNFYGEVDYSSGKRVVLPAKRRDARWRDHYNNPSEHYGWVVECDPHKKTSKKLTGLGRFAHESATVYPLPDGRVVVYSADDKYNECLYKFISSQPGSLDAGELFVADIENGKWISLDINKNPNLQKTFKNQLDVLIQTRRAAHLVGATRLDRPEDVEVQPDTKDVYVTLTKNPKKGNHFGSILKVSYLGGDHLKDEFKASTFIAGGENTGFACPDNLAFDKKGNLWMCCDVSTRSIGKGKYEFFKNNALFYIPIKGPGAGKAHRVATGPVDSELTGISFSPDGETLFLSVQHPGELSPSLQNPTSRWPNYGNDIPRSAVVSIRGKALSQLMKS